MVIIRWVLARFILLADFLYRPKHPSRTVETQQALERQLSQLALYQYAACPFCVKVRWAMKRHNIQVPLKDAKRKPEFAQELTLQGGRLKVPCLRINDEAGKTQWLYESNDIIRYLDNIVASIQEPEQSH